LENILLRQAVATATRVSDSSRDQVPQWAGRPFLILLACLPYGEVLHDYFRYQLFGFAAETTVIPTFVLFILFVLIAVFRKPFLLIYAALFLGLIGLVLAARYLWGLDLTVNDTAHQAVGVRYIILVPIYILVAGYVLRDAFYRRMTTIIILINGAIAACVGILYVLGVIAYRVVPEGSELESLYGNGEIGRAAGLLAGVNVYSSFLVLALVIACFVYDRSAVIRIAAISIMILGVLVSQSRWPLMCTVIVLGTTILLHERKQNKKRLLLVALSVLIALGGAYFATNAGNTLVGGVQGRLSQGMGEDIGVRQSKYEIGLSAILESPYTVIAGATPENLIQGYKQEYIFSDNGIFSMFITAGVPVTILFILLCYRCLAMFAFEWRRLSLCVFGLIVGGVLFFNNAIYWDMWLFHAAAICFLLTHSSEREQEQTE